MSENKFSRAQQYSSEEAEDIAKREKKIVQEIGSDPPTREDHIAAMELAKDDFIGREKTNDERDKRWEQLLGGRILMRPPSSVVNWTVDFYSTDPIWRERFHRAAMKVLSPHQGLPRFTEERNSEFCSWEILGMDKASPSKILEELRDEMKRLLKEEKSPKE